MGTPARPGRTNVPDLRRRITKEPRETGHHPPRTSDGPSGNLFLAACSSHATTSLEYFAHSFLEFVGRLLDGLPGFADRLVRSAFLANVLTAGQYAGSCP